MKIAHYFYVLANDIPHLEYQFARFGNMLYQQAAKILKDAGVKKPIKVFEKFKPVSILYDSNIPVPSGISTRIGAMIIVSASIPFTLRAQLVRHRGIHMQDEFLDFIKDENIFNATMESPITVQISGTNSEMREVLSHRSCWIANYKIWANILRKIEDNLDPDINPLPCRDGQCPFHGDAVLRIEGKDPNPPCPIHMRLTSTQASQGQIDAMQQMVVSDRRSQVFWDRQIGALS
jgi:hypothetical protein